MVWSEMDARSAEREKEGMERRTMSTRRRECCVESPRRRSWLGFGIESTPNAATPSIADDIRMNFADDDDLFLSPSVTLKSSHISSHQLMETSRSLSRSASGVDIALRRLASQHRLRDLQREVDEALEFFHQETENELDSNSDGDEYLNGHDKFQQQEHNSNMGRQHRIISRGSECDGSGNTSPSIATSMTTSMATSDDANYYDEFDGRQSTKFSLETETSNASTMIFDEFSSMKHKTRSFVSLPLSLLTSEAMTCSDDEDEDAVETSKNMSFNMDLDFGRSLRSAMEPFLTVARLRREEARQGVFAILDTMLPPGLHGNASQWSAPLAFSSEQPHCIGSNYGVPYPSLRNESSFLYDIDSFPLDRVFAETLGVKNLSQIHVDHPLIKDKARLLATLQNRVCHRKFHHLFDSFVTSHVIPLLHARALSKGIFYTNRHQLQAGRPQRIIYRYQAFPSIDIVRPGEASTDPHCDIAKGHSIGNISFHIPLTSSFRTNAIYTESLPGREDWHPLEAKSPGLGFQFDGARCLHFNLRNETNVTRVSLAFHIAITRAPESFDNVYDPNDQLCCSELLKDKFVQEKPGFYDEVVVNVGQIPRSYLPGPLATKWRGGGISAIG